MIRGFLSLRTYAFDMPRKMLEEQLLTELNNLVKLWVNADNPFTRTSYQKNIINLASEYKNVSGKDYMYRNMMTFHQPSPDRKNANGLRVKPSLQ
jgi:hypothetical protein